jgi:TonB family protein
MKEILMYALGVVVCSGVFTAFYRTVMHQRTSFHIARAFLVASMVAAAIIPVFDIPVWRSEPIELPAFDFTAMPVASHVAPAQVDLWPVALLCLWGVGIAVLVTLMIVQTVKIHRTKRRAEVYTTPEYEVAVSADVESPFSFLQTVYVTSGTPPNEMQQIILHEASHIRHRHSVEKIVMETLKTLLWFNPFAWIAARLLNEVQEFEADRDVLLGGCTVEEYLPVIFKQVFGYAPEISTALGNSLTKKRFEMMTKKLKHTKFSWLRTVGAVPLVTAMMMLFGFTHRAPEIITQKPKTTEITSVTVGSDKAAPSGSSINSVTVRSRDGKVDNEVNNFSNAIFWLTNENKEITTDEMKAIAPYEIESVSVLKEAAAMKPYIDKTGWESADGVVVIALKGDDAKSDSKVSTTVNVIKVGASGSDKTPQIIAVSTRSKSGTPAEEFSMDKSKVFLWLSNGNKEISKDEMNAIDQKSIETISVLKEKSSFPDDVKRAMGNREFDSAVMIELKTSEVGKDAPIYIADEMPTFQGGDLAAFRNWVLSNMTYPKAAYEKKIQGKVHMKFVIERDGSISSIEALSSPDQLLTDAAIEALKKSPKWTPGKQDGKTVRVSFVLPIDFSL